MHITVRLTIDWTRKDKDQASKNQDKDKDSRHTSDTSISPTLVHSDLHLQRPTLASSGGNCAPLTHTV